MVGKVLRLAVAVLANIDAESEHELPEGVDADNHGTRAARMKARHERWRAQALSRTADRARQWAGGEDETDWLFVEDAGLGSL